MKKLLVAALLFAALANAPTTLSHLENAAFYQSYRQSLFALLGANFGSMGSMIKGEIPWDAGRFRRWAEDLASVARLDVLRGFPPTSTPASRSRARPVIWDNMADFETKLNDLRRESARLAELAGTAATDSADIKAIRLQFLRTGGSCKACHDDYKSKNYL